jgi:tripartite-type tricarboxylate transporter receptor subunit TctC
MKKIFVSAVIFLAFATSGFSDYPNKTINLVVPSKAGGSTDTTARLFAETAKKYWSDADFIVVNKPGAGGLIGFEYEARAKADGYTLGLMFTPQFVAHIVSKTAKYNIDTFKVVGNVAEDQGIVVVNAASPIMNLADLAKAAKEKKLTAIVNGIGSDDFLAAKNFEEVAGVEFNLVPTKGSTEQKAAVLGNHVDVGFMNLSQMLSQHKAGQVRIIAILSKKRAKAAPEVLTSIEQNFNVLMSATRGFIIHKNVDKDIQDKIIDLYTKVVNDAEFQERCEKTYIFLDPMNSAEYTSYLKELQATTQKVYDKNPW